MAGPRYIADKTPDPEPLRHRRLDLLDLAPVVGWLWFVVLPIVLLYILFFHD